MPSKGEVSINGDVAHCKTDLSHLVCDVSDLSQ